MDLNKEILNEGLGLSMEFGENWLMDIDNRLHEKYPKLTETELKNCDQLCRKINKYAHSFFCNNHITDEKGITFIHFSKFEDFMKLKYNWIHNDNLSKLYSQGCYYALK